MEERHHERSAESYLLYDLGDCSFHASHGELRSKITDDYIHIEKKVAQVFECLAKAQGEIVTREEIFAHVWPNLIVSDDSLNRCISVLRKKLKLFDHQLTIKTHPKIGFNLESACFNCHDLKGSAACSSLNPIKKIDWKKRYLQSAVFTVLIVFIMSTFLIHNYSPSFRASEAPVRQPIISNNKIIIMPFKLDAKVLKNNPLLEMEFRQLIANHPMHDSIASDELAQTKLKSPRLVGQHFNASYVVEAQGYYQDGREILNWQLVDAKTGVELLNRKLNLALNSTDINSRQLATEFVDTFANIHYPDNSAEHMQYIVNSVRYLFTPHSKQKFQRPVITLLASKIAQVDPESIIALKLLAELLTQAVLFNSETNISYINLAIMTLEKLANEDIADTEVFQSLSKLYLLKYRWTDARSILDKGDAVLKTQGQSMRLEREMLFTLTGHHTKFSTAKLLQAYRQQPFSQENAIKLITVLLENQQYQKALQIADDFDLDHDIWRAIGHFIGPLYLNANNLQRGTHITTKGYLSKGLEQKSIDLLISALIDPLKQKNVVKQLSQTAQKQSIPPLIQLLLYANLAANDHYFELAFTLADAYQFNVLSTTLHSNSKLRYDDRFLPLMEKISLTSYWKTYGYPDFCRIDLNIRCQ
jgi:DNA-binding winged helix-turn-helix (wHTH) protein